MVDDESVVDPTSWQTSALRLVVIDAVDAVTSAAPVLAVGSSISIGVDVLVGTLRAPPA
jgi:hypothetical protein